MLISWINTHTQICIFVGVIYSQQHLVLLSCFLVSRFYYLLDYHYVNNEKHMIHAYKYTNNRRTGTILSNYYLTFIPNNFFTFSWLSFAPRRHFVPVFTLLSRASSRKNIFLSLESVSPLFVDFFFIFSSAASCSWGVYFVGGDSSSNNKTLLLLYAFIKHLIKNVSKLNEKCTKQENIERTRKRKNGTEWKLQWKRKHKW